MSSRADSGQGPWQLKRVKSTTGPVGTSLSDACREPYSVSGQTEMLWIASTSKRITDKEAIMQMAAKEFDQVFEMNDQKAPNLIQSDQLGSNLVSFVITTNSRNDANIIKTFSRSRKLSEKGKPVHVIPAMREEELREIHIQLHSPYELPQMIKDLTQTTDLEKLTLKSGHEYLIEIGK